MFLERIEGLFASLSGEDERQTPSFAQAQGEIARDDVTRDRYLRFAEYADRPQIRARMIRARGHGWAGCRSQDERAELTRMIGDVLGRKTVGAADVDLICTLNKDHALDQERYRLSISAADAEQVTHAAALGCLGSTEGRARVLAGADQQ